MNILEVNTNTLANLYDQYPESFKGLSLDGNNLVYNDQYVDISKFNINDLLSGDNNFAASLSVLSSEDVFKIIRLHAISLSSTLDNTPKMEEEEKINIIKSENPLMKNINIFKQVHHGFTEEYINIVDSNGVDHLFHKDRENDIFLVYEQLKARKMGGDVTPDELVAEMNRKLYEVDLVDSLNLLNSSNISEDFANKLRIVSQPYKDDKSIRVYGNEEHDVVIIRDLDDPSKHKIITFDTNEFGDLVMQNHDQNVIGTDTSVTHGEETETTTSSETSDGTDSNQEIIEKNEEEVAAVLINTDEFYKLLNSVEELTEEQRKSVDLYYAYFGDLILYEDYLLPELKQILNDFRAYVYELQYGELESGMERQLNAKQQEAIEKEAEMELKVAAVQSEELTEEKAKESVKKLELIKPVNNYGDNSGSVSVLQVIAVIIGISIILTAITLYLIG